MSLVNNSKPKSVSKNEENFFPLPYKWSIVLLPGSATA